MGIIVERALFEDHGTSSKSLHQMAVRREVFPHAALVLWMKMACEPVTRLSTSEKGVLASECWQPGSIRLNRLDSKGVRSIGDGLE